MAAGAILLVMAASVTVPILYRPRTAQDDPAGRTQEAANREKAPNAGAPPNAAAPATVSPPSPRSEGRAPQPHAEPAGSGTPVAPPPDAARTGSVECSVGRAGSAINAIALTPDARYVVAATDDGQLRIWRTSCSAETASVFWREASSAQAVTINGTGTRIAAAWSGDNLVRVWELAGGLGGTATRPQLLEGHPDPVVSLAFGDRDHLFSASDSLVQEWNVPAGEGHPFALGSFRGVITSLVAVRSGGVLAAASAAGSIAAWNQGSPNPSRVFGASCHNIRSLAMARTGVLAAGCSDGSVLVCSAGGSACQALASRDQGPFAIAGDNGVTLTALAFDAAGTSLATGDARGTLTIRDTRSGAPLDSSDGHGTSRITAMEFSAVGRTLVSSDAAGTVRMWDLSRLR